MTPEQFGNIILRADGPQGVLYLKDVARIELGAQSYDVRTALNGEPGAGMPVFLQPGANALDTKNALVTKMDELKKRFPPGMDYVVPYDTSLFVKASMWEVVKTLGEAMVLVILVVYLFLQSWRATLIPLIAVPISLIGTFAGLWLFGFSINTLTLFAMVLSIGIVVDDAIVVLENIERLMDEEKLSPMKAAIKSMEQVASAVVAIVLVLCAVFVPVAFMGGIAGELYRQFAVTVAVAVTISGVVALTLDACPVRHPAKAHAWGVGILSCFQSEFQAPYRFLREYGQHYHTAQDYWRDRVLWHHRTGGIPDQDST